MLTYFPVTQFHLLLPALRLVNEHSNGSPTAQQRRWTATGV